MNSNRCASISVDGAIIVTGFALLLTLRTWTSDPPKMLDFHFQELWLAGKYYRKCSSKYLRSERFPHSSSNTSSLHSLSVWRYHISSRQWSCAPGSFLISDILSGHECSHINLSLSVGEKLLMWQQLCTKQCKCNTSTYRWPNVPTQAGALNFPCSKWPGQLMDINRRHKAECLVLLLKKPRAHHVHYSCGASFKPPTYVEIHYNCTFKVFLTDQHKIPTMATRVSCPVYQQLAQVN